MKLKIIFFLCFLSIFSHAQEIASLNSLTREKVHVNTNSNLFLVGEVLYYNFFSIVSTNNTPSLISKIGYVKLIGENGKILFSHKLKLNSGIGYGDYFIPSDIQTGQYKLIAYTKWIEDDSDSIFLGNVCIINPYISSHNNQESESVIDIQINESKKDESLENENKIEIQTSSSIFKTRSFVSVNLNNRFEDLYHGNYSLSVRKVSPIEIKDIVEEDHSILKQKSSFDILPEVRGENISGVVKFKYKDSIIPNVIVTLSIPGKNYIFKNVKTDKWGRFNFNLYENFKTSDALVQILSDQKDDYKITLDDPNFIDYSNLDFKKIKINQNIKDWLIKQSIYSQIENTYYNTKKDSVLVGFLPNLFYGKATINYLLDDYERFPTLKETFIEVIQAGAIRKNNDDFEFKVFDYSEDINNYFANYNSLVLFDGVLIQNKKDIMDYDVKNIESINLVRGTYFYGPSVFYGIIDIKTKKGDFKFQANGNDVLTFNYEAPINTKIYYSPNYEKNLNNLKRIPDYRSQLIWLPNLKLDSNLETIQFYSSDVEGVFEILLEGFTYSGKQVISKNYFEVKNN